MIEQAKKITLVEVIQSCSDNGKGITYISGDSEEEFLSYQALYEKALHILYNLQAAGIKPQDELVFQIQDNKHFMSMFWACLLGNIIPIPISVGSNDEHRLKLFKIWNVLNNPYLVADPDVLSKLQTFAEKQSSNLRIEQIASKTLFIDELLQSSGQGTIQSSKSDSIAFVQFSSGSTGDPKGVILSHENLLTNIYAIIRCSEWSHDDRILSWMPLTHDLGMIGCHLAPIVRNMNQFHIPTPLFIRRPSLWLKKASEHRITLLQSPNFGYKYFLTFFKPEMATDWDLSCVRTIYNGAEPISADICRRFLAEMEQYGLKRNSMYTVYGMAEASLAVCFPRIGEEFRTVYVHRDHLNVGEPVIEVDSEHAQSVCFVDEGYPLDDCFVRVCGDDDLPLAENTVGHIQISGKNVTKGYYNNKEVTEQTFTKDGWLKTGDLGFLRDSRLVVTGRAKDIIFVNGHNYYPHDIERVAEEIEGVELGKIAVCGAFNKQIQKEDIVAFILFKKQNKEFVPLAKRLKTYINLKMGLNLDSVIPIRDIPKTTSGKLQRYKLGQKYQDGEYDAIIDEIHNLVLKSYEDREIVEAVTETEQKLMQICRDVLHTHVIGIEDNFLEIGISSLMVSQIVARIDELHIGQVKPTDLFSYPTIFKLAGFIDSQKRGVLPPLKLPEDYFLDEGSNRFARSSCEVTIQDEVLTSMKEMLVNEHISLDAILLSSFIYLLSTISGESEITVQTMLYNSYAVSPLSINIEQYDDISTFFKGVNARIKSREGLELLPVQALNQLSLSKRQRSVIPLYCHTAYRQQNLQNSGLVDMMIEIDDRSDYITIVCHYNNLKLSSRKIEEFMFNYLRFVKQILAV